MAHRKGFGDTCTARFCIHARAMPLSVQATGDTILINRQVSKPGEFVRQQGRLIETSRAFAICVQRHRDDQVCDIKRRALLRFTQHPRQPARHSWLAFQRQHRCAQSAGVQAASPCVRELIIVALAAANGVALFASDTAPAWRTAFPTNGVTRIEEASAGPAFGTSHSVVTRLDAVSADGDSVRCSVDDER